MAETNPHGRPNGKPRGGHLLPDGRREHRYSRELAAKILRRLATGETLAAICDDPGIPVTPGAVRQWIIDDRGGFASDYTRARRAQAECWADQLLEIADDDRLEPNDRCVRLDVRKWLMARLNRARYGDRIRVAGDDENPVRHVVAVELAQLTELELTALENFVDTRLVMKDAQHGG